VPVVGLHGTLARLSCTVCKSSVAYEQHERLKAGEAPACGSCVERIKERVERGQRKLRSGVLRPDIVLYNEPHPQGELIAEHLAADLARRPAMLLVIGTSLKVVGLKRMIKDVARAVHANSPDGLVVYMNKTPVLARSEWRGVFDCELVGECDAWVSRLRAARKGAVAERKSVAAAAVTVAAAAARSPPRETGVTPKPAAKTKKIDSFFKHVKKTVLGGGKAVDKENVPQENAAPKARRTRAAAATATH
jgi:hypothetical protein